MTDVLITYCGRDYYAKRLFASLQRNWTELSSLNVVFVANGAAQPSKETFCGLEHKFGGFKMIHLQTKRSIGFVLRGFVENYSVSDDFWKLDEDAELVSPDFDAHATAVRSIIPGAIWSPFPVGLIRNLGGPSATRHQVHYNETIDTQYTLRFTNHIGGFCRFMPSEYLKDIKFQDGHDEDANVSQWASRKGIPMFYLENAMVVEHQESTLGQQKRYPEYFGERKI